MEDKCTVHGLEKRLCSQPNPVWEKRTYFVSSNNCEKCNFISNTGTHTTYKSKFTLREELEDLRQGRSERSRRESSDSRVSSDRDLGQVFLDQVSRGGVREAAERAQTAGSA